MKKSGIILVDKAYSSKELFKIAGTADNSALSIYVDDDLTLDLQLKNRVMFDLNMNLYRHELDSAPSEFRDLEIEKIEYFSSNFDNLFNDSDYISFDFTDTNPKEYIKNNPFILDKKIVVNKSIDFSDFRSLKNILKKYDGFHDKVYINLNNNGYVSLKNCFESMFEIEQSLKEYLNLGLSPFETVMYVYDKVRSNVYTPECGYNDFNTCVNQANIFNAILRNLCFSSRTILLHEKDEPEITHVRNSVYIRDYKYNIDGYYYFDPAFDSKSFGQDDDYINYYRYFAKTRDEMVKIDKEDGNSYIYDDLSSYTSNMNDDITEIIRNGNISLLGDYRKTINNMCWYTGSRSIINSSVLSSINDGKLYFNGEVFIDDFEYIFNKYKNVIPAEKMIQVLLKIRKQEYSLDNKLYDYSYDSIKNTSKVSKWEFSKSKSDNALEYLPGVLGSEPSYDELFSQFANRIDMKNEIMAIVNARTLRRVNNHYRK